MKAKAYVGLLDGVDMTNEDIKAAISDIVCEAVDSAKPDVTISFNPNEPSRLNMILFGNSDDVIKGLSGITAAIAAKVYPFDVVKDDVVCTIVLKKEES